MDPKRVGFSSYIGMGNNPVSNTDADGGKPQDIITKFNGREIDRVVTKDPFDIVINYSEGSGGPLNLPAIFTVGIFAKPAGLATGELGRPLIDPIDLLGGFASAFFKGGTKTGAKGAINLAEATWAQKTFSPMFSAEGRFAGRTVDDVAGALRSGAMSAADVPIDVIIRHGQTVILNTRSSAALIRGAVPKGQWSVFNRTGESFFENMLNGQFRRNGLSQGVNTIRQSGTKMTLSNH
jgi:hypothetical protein